MDLISLLTMWQFWVVLAGVFWLGIYKVVPLVKRLPKKQAMYGSLLIAVLVSGVLGGAFALSGTASLSSSGVSISQLQTTTAYQFTNGSAVADSGSDDTKMSDFYIDEEDMDAGVGFIDTGVFLVTRSGDLDPASCQVRVIKPPRYDISDTTYHIVDEDSTTGKMSAYVHTGASTGAATASDPKESNMLAFDRGVATGYASFNITLDETGFDPLTQYDYKDIHVDVCGYDYVFRVHKNDA